MKCPNCGETVYALDTIDTEYDSGTYYDTVEGACPDCGMSWQWIEVFTFERDENIKPININGHL